MLLPIAIRELRVSARNKATHRLRLYFAVGAVAVGGGIGLLFSMSGGIPGSQAGILIFGALKWIAFVFACAAGVFLTADCLSEEKREGTLGLLFLTDLRGHDVVLGKLLATSLRTFYSLLAIFPVMALSFVLGGVAAEDFQHSLLSLCNTLFFSLALGMAVSAMSRDPHKAMTAALAAMAVFLFVIPGLDTTGPGGIGVMPRIALLSPLFAITHTGSYHAADFWLSMIEVNVAGWLFLGIASWLTPKTWHEKNVRYGPGKGWRIPLFGAAAARSGGRKLAEENPVCWIISRDRWTSMLARLALLLVFAVLALSLASLFQHRGPAAPVPGTIGTAASTTTTISLGGTTTTTVSLGVGRVSVMAESTLFAIASTCAGLLSLALEFWLASHVCRFYVDGKRSGFLELMMVTPTTRADILAGHWLALRRLFLAPVLAQLLLTLTCQGIRVWAVYSAAAAAQGGKTIPAASNFDAEVLQITGLVLGAVAWFIGLITLAWFSIWMGITSKKIPVAMLKTFWYAKILPGFGISFCSGILLVMLMTNGSLWLLPVVIQLIWIGVNLALIALARRRAQDAFSKWSNLAAA
jgi:ABC-type transport system involved in cytochrome c biogenesis permease component